jgi:putative membrane protein insertion efficiency factor
VTVPALLLTALVRIYQGAMRPLIGSNCRFHPSCSDYAVEALATHGAWRGALLAGRRILRCNPWMPGGYDPVPPPDCDTPDCHTTVCDSTVSKGRAAH